MSPYRTKQNNTLAQEPQLHRCTHTYTACVFTWWPRVFVFWGFFLRRTSMFCCQATRSQLTRGDTISTSLLGPCQNTFKLTAYCPDIWGLFFAALILSRRFVCVCVLLFLCVPFFFKLHIKKISPRLLCGMFFKLYIPPFMDYVVESVQ